MSRKKNPRGKDPTWRIVKYKGDVSYYARCKCGYHCICSFPGNVSKGEPIAVFDSGMLYPYCPVCGSKKKWYEDDFETLDMYPWEDA